MASKKLKVSEIEVIGSIKLSMFHSKNTFILCKLLKSVLSRTFGQNLSSRCLKYTIKVFTETYTY